MKHTFVMPLDEIFECDDLFHELELIQDGGKSHEVKMFSETKEDAAYELAFRLVPFFKKHLEALGD